MSTVLLAGGPALVRAAMAQVIEASRAFDVVGEAADEVRFREALQVSSRPDMVLLDRTIRLDGAVRGEDADAFADTVAVASAAARTIVFGIADAQEADACLRAGATGVLAADITAAQLVAALETVSRGGLVVVLETAPAIAVRRLRTAGPEAIPKLSRRERQILTMLASGQESSTMAAALSISPLTVKSHMANLFAKIGVRQRGHAVAFAYEHGLVVPGGTPVIPFMSQLSQAS